MESGIADYFSGQFIARKQMSAHSSEVLVTGAVAW